jgi:hypothetical protein
VWPGTTLFFFVLVGRLFHWPGVDQTWSYLYWVGMALPCILLACLGDNFIDIAGKALVDVRRGWKDLWAYQLNRYPDLEYVPAKVIPAEGFQPIATLPGGVRLFLPTMGNVHAFWVRVPSDPDPDKPAPKLWRDSPVTRDPRTAPARYPRAYPLASYRNYIFLPFAPNEATLEMRFMLFHEIGHALFSRSFPAIGQIQTWPCFLLLMIGALVVTGMDWSMVWPLCAILVVWQSVTLLRTAPSFERERFSELWADFYAIVHMRSVPDLRSFIEKQISGLRANRQPAEIERADDLETLLKTIGPQSADKNGASPALGVEQLSNLHGRLVRNGSEHPTLLTLLAAFCLAVVGVQLASVRPEPMMAFAIVYAVVPFLFCYLGTSRQSAREAGRVDRFLRDRRPPGEEQDALPLVFS